jgi:hypothetical protein
MDPRDKGTPEIERNTISFTVLKGSKHPVAAIHGELLNGSVMDFSLSPQYDWG